MNTNKHDLLMLIVSCLFVFIQGLSSIAIAQTESAPFTVYEKTRQPLLMWAVFVADTTETFASRYDKERVSTGSAQAIIEQDLMDYGFDLVNIDVAMTENELPQRTQVLKKAKAVNADYLIYGQVNASRILGSESGSVSGGHSRSRPFEGRNTEWGGVNRPENTADISVQVIRVSDGHLMAADHAGSTGSAQARSHGVQGAVNEATSRLLRSLVPKLEDIQRDERRQTKRTVIEL